MGRPRSCAPGEPGAACRLLQSLSGTPGPCRSSAWPPGDGRRGATDEQADGEVEGGGGGGGGDREAVRQGGGDAPGGRGARAAGGGHSLGLGGVGSSARSGRLPARGRGGVVWQPILRESGE